MELLHHGAHQGVTGSCHELRWTDNYGILVDCGLQQGVDIGIDNLAFWQRTERRPLQALCITHAHIDHIGRIPDLVMAGFNAPIFCTRASAELIPLMLADGLKFNEAIERDERAPLIEQIIALLVPCDYHQWLSLEPECGIPKTAIRFLPAGHILGSAAIEVHSKLTETQQRVVFSGDIGCHDTPLICDPEAPEYADILVLESTYGDRLHDNRGNRQQHLQKIIEHAFQDNGAVLIPAFAIGRTQELLYEIEAIIHANPDWSDYTVILDSPLALKVTQAYDHWQQLWDKEANTLRHQGRHPLDFKQLQIVTNHDDHLRVVEHLKRHATPCIVIAGSGMCNGGRIVNYLEALLPDHRTDVVFVGYQANGTFGEALQQAALAKKAFIHHHKTAIPLRAHIHTLSGYSAHADQAGLIRYVTDMKTPPAEIRLVHGEQSAKEHLARKLRKALHTSVNVKINHSI